VAKVILATRQSPLAVAQAGLVAARVRAVLGAEAELRKIVTTGDRRTEWSLEQKGGKGLFTAELEESLRRGEADAAVHSTKDLPGEVTPGLVVAAYLPRADPRDVLIRRAGTGDPAVAATDSPRRRLQLALQYSGLSFVGIRGNVDTRLRKIAAGAADATVLAAAGLSRLGIESWPGLEFQELDFDLMVPAVGQGAIAVQCREADAGRWAKISDPATARAVGVERALQTVLGGGCHTAFGAHATEDTLYLFHEKVGRRRVPLSSEAFAAPAEWAVKTLKGIGLY